MPLTKADEVINSINKLPKADLQELTHKVRTTKDGINAYVAFNHGIPAPVEIAETGEVGETGETGETTENNPTS